MNANTHPETNDDKMAPRYSLTRYCFINKKRLIKNNKDKIITLVNVGIVKIFLIN
jgi:hypothetical protein